MEMPFRHRFTRIAARESGGNAEKIALMHGKLGLEIEPSTGMDALTVLDTARHLKNHWLSSIQSSRQNGIPHGTVHSHQKMCFHIATEAFSGSAGQHPNTSGSSKSRVETGEAVVARIVLGGGHLRAVVSQCAFQKSPPNGIQRKMKGWALKMYAFQVKKACGGNAPTILLMSGRRA